MNAILSTTPKSLLQYLKDETALSIVMAAILALIIVLAVLLILQIVKEKKKQAQAENSPENESEIKPINPPENESEAKPINPPKNEAEVKPVSPPENESKAEPEVKPVNPPENEQEAESERPKDGAAASVPTLEVQTTVETKAEKSAAEEKNGEEQEMKQEKISKSGTKPIPAQNDARKKEAKPKAAAIEKDPKPKAAPAAKSTGSGKWILFREERGGFGFKLIASNGEVMLLSSAPYATVQSAKSGIKTYRDNIKAGRLETVETKSGSFFVKINNANGRLLATSADYKTRTSAESAAESIRRWAESAAIVMDEGFDEKNNEKK